MMNYKIESIYLEKKKNEEPQGVIKLSHDHAEDITITIDVENVRRLGMLLKACNQTPELTINPENSINGDVTDNFNLIRK